MTDEEKPSARQRQLTTTFVTENADALENERRFLAVHWLHPNPELLPIKLVEDITLGRSPECHVVLEGDSVSRQHARILREGSTFMLQDLESANGSFHNGKRIRQATLGPGDIVRIGPWVGLVDRITENDLEQSVRITELAPGLWGGPVLRKIVEPIERIAASDLPLIATGPTGTGKERVAGAVHAWSRRAGDFCAVNCAAIPAQLAEGELFGYRKGAFTGADRSARGYFRAAHGGTLLLDEIQELPQELQPKLLRVIQERAVVPLGEERPLPIDVRLVVTGQKPLRRLVELDRFRLDLYMRLAGLEVDIPPLSARVPDIPQLFHLFLGQLLNQPAPKLHADLVERLCLYEWPGNVRELELLARRLAIMHAKEPWLRALHLPPELRLEVSGTDESSSGLNRREQDIMRLARVLKTNGGNIARASQQLGISRQRIYRLLNGRSVQEFLQQMEV